MPSPEPRFTRLANSVEPIASALALILLLATWIALYPVLCPADSAQVPFGHVAKVRT